jgi:hypothetical protein
MSEVFAWDEGRVVKLFRPAYDHAVEREHDCADAVHQAGVASPAVRYQGLRPDQHAGALRRERTVRARILDSYLAAYLAAEPIVTEELASWLARAASSQHRSEPGSADAADLEALVSRNHHDLIEPVLERLLAR